MTYVRSIVASRSVVIYITRVTLHSDPVLATAVTNTVAVLVQERGPQHAKCDAGQPRGSCPPPSVPRQLHFHSPLRVSHFRFPQERVRAELRACPSDPFSLEVAGPVSSRIPLTGTRFVKPAKGVTLMLGLTPRHWALR